MTTTGRTAIRTMSVNGLSCILHMPKATTSRFDERGKEIVGHLAPSAPVDVYRVDDYPGCPRDWLRDDPAANLASYFFRAEPGHMVWLDFNANARHPHHVAALLSAQGVNAIDGRHVTLPIELAQYINACPIHQEKFTGDRHCAACGYDWPAQNYMATTTTPYGRFWRDGFRGADGKTREFIFTEQKERGVAFNLIGEARTDAFGIALFVSKEPKPEPPPTAYPRGGLLGGHADGLESFGGGPKTLGATRSLRSAAPKSLEVGAGALVEQDVKADDRRIDYWQTEPAALIRIYYCGAEDFADITGIRGGSAKGNEGFLGGIPTGNK